MHNLNNFSLWNKLCNLVVSEIVAKNFCYTLNSILYGPVWDDHKLNFTLPLQQWLTMSHWSFRVSCALPEKCFNSSGQSRYFRTLFCGIRKNELHWGNNDWYKWGWFLSKEQCKEKDRALPASTLLLYNFILPFICAKNIQNWSDWLKLLEFLSRRVHQTKEDW